MEVTVLSAELLSMGPLQISLLPEEQSRGIAVAGVHVREADISEKYHSEHTHQGHVLLRTL